VNIIRQDGPHLIERPAVAPGRRAEDAEYLVLLAVAEAHPEGDALLLEATPEEAVDFAADLVAAADRAREWARAEAAGDVRFGDVDAPS
jgi:hypothetical protein